MSSIPNHKENSCSTANREHDGSDDTNAVSIPQPNKIWCRRSCTCRLPHLQSLRDQTSWLDVVTGQFQPCNFCRPDLDSLPMKGAVDCSPKQPFVASIPENQALEISQRQAPRVIQDPYSGLQRPQRVFREINHRDAYIGTPPNSRNSNHAAAHGVDHFVSPSLHESDAFQHISTLAAGPSLPSACHVEPLPEVDPEPESMDEEMNFTKMLSAIMYNQTEQSTWDGEFQKIEQPDSSDKLPSSSTPGMTNEKKASDDEFQMLAISSSDDLLEYFEREHERIIEESIEPPERDKQSQMTEQPEPARTNLVEPSAFEPVTASGQSPKRACGPKLPLDQGETRNKKVKVNQNKVAAVVEDDHPLMLYGSAVLAANETIPQTPQAASVPFHLSRQPFQHQPHHLLQESSASFYISPYSNFTSPSTSSSSPSIYLSPLSSFSDYICAGHDAAGAVAAGANADADADAQTAQLPDSPTTCSSKNEYTSYDLFLSSSRAGGLPSSQRHLSPSVNAYSGQAAAPLDSPASVMTTVDHSSNSLAAHQSLEYTVQPFRAGFVLIGASSGRLCALDTGDSEAQLVRALCTQFQNWVVVLSDWSPSLPSTSSSSTPVKNSNHAVFGEIYEGLITPSGKTITLPEDVWHRAAWLAIIERRQAQASQAYGIHE